MDAGTTPASKPKRRGGGKRGIGGKKRVTALKGTWRVFNVEVPVSQDPGKDHVGLSDALLRALAAKLGLLDAKDDLTALAELQAQDRRISVVRKSFDARRSGRRGGGGANSEEEGPSFTYVVDLELGARALKVKMKPESGRLEVSSGEHTPSLQSVLSEVLGGRAKQGGGDAAEKGAEKEKSGTTSPTVSAESDIAEPSLIQTSTSERSGPSPASSAGSKGGKLPVAVIGSGPAGLFAALTLAESGVKCIVIERGQPVEERGRDIGAMLHRRILDQDSNICYGEGGAGTWSDGKLTTRIGRNSGAVRYVLSQLVRFGAPEGILVQGKPHLGTDRLVRILKSLRTYLEEHGVTFMFGTRVEDITVSAQGVTGLKYRAVHTRSAGSEHAGTLEELRVQTIVMAAGHSARELYQAIGTKAQSEAAVQAKAFAVGFRIEHPQALINSLQLGPEWAGQVDMGRGKVPVADYRLATQIPYPVPPQAALESALGQEWGSLASVEGARPSKSAEGRPVYSFCMCPGGQVVCTSVLPDELCVNGMSFSKRQSRWANSALVTAVEPDEAFLQPYIEEARNLPGGGHPAMAGLQFQRAMEQEACRRGGGNLVAPVQRATDFIEGRPSEGGPDFPSSSYRLGVKPAALHDLYPPSLTLALREALLAFDKRLPGFLSPQALLHGVETRTSSPIRVARDQQSLQCLGLPGLFPCGEGAGYAGGIVSSAVDGVRVGAAVLQELGVAGGGLEGAA